MVILKCSIYITLRAMRSCVPVEAAANEESIFARAKGHRRRRRQLGRRGIGERIVCRRASQMRRVPRRRGRVNRRGGPTLGIDWDAAERRARGCVQQKHLWCPTAHDRTGRRRRRWAFAGGAPHVYNIFYYIVYSILQRNRREGQQYALRRLRVMS